MPQRNLSVYNPSCKTTRQTINQHLIIIFLIWLICLCI